MRGIVHLSRIGHGDFRVSFGPLGPPGTGGSIPVRNLPTIDSVEMLLRELRVDGGRQGWRPTLERTGSAHVGVVDIPEHTLREKRLV